MPVQFALRPRLRISEGFTPPRRSRFRLPKFALPIATYWLVAAGITYALVHAHDDSNGSTAERIASNESEMVPSAPDSQSVTNSAATPRASAVPSGVEPALLEAPAPVEPVAAPELALMRATPREAVSDFASSAEPAAPRAASVTHEVPLSEALPALHLSDSDPDRAVRRVAQRAESAPAEASLRAPGGSDSPASATTFPSCEAAAASTHEQLMIGQSDPSPDLSREAIAAVLDSGVWIVRCDVPFSTTVELCVAIKEGKVVGVSVDSRPKNLQLDLCLKRRAFGLQFPYSTRLDLARTRF
jgi:hypothetical protein